MEVIIALMLGITGWAVYQDTKQEPEPTIVIMVEPGECGFGEKETRIRNLTMKESEGQLYLKDGVPCVQK